MKTHVEIRIVLKLPVGKTLHDVLRAFAKSTRGWKWPLKESKDYQSSNDGQAGFVVSDSIKGLERAAVAVACLGPTRLNSFGVMNIVPTRSSSLSIDQYNAIGLTFAESFRRFLRTTKQGGKVEVEGPDIGLPQIVRAPKCRRIFEQYVRKSDPCSHPSDIHYLDLFICSLFRYRAYVRLDLIETYLIVDETWKPEDAAWVTRRIDTGLEVLKINRRF
jgi:hypothetical protein